MKILNYILLLSALFAMYSCGGGDDDGGGGGTDDPRPIAMVPDPEATTLVFPENNTECNEGVIISETRSQVTFRWGASNNTDSYEVTVRNLNTNQSFSVRSNTTEVDIAIDRGTPYEWFVVSNADGTNASATSSSFRFYNQGPGIVNYAPFPADVISPARGANLTDVGGTVTLQWSGSDIDNDIATYEVFLGTDPAATASLGTTTDSTMDAAVNVGTIYYWTVISTDSQGNTSESEVFEFRVSS